MLKELAYNFDRGLGIIDLALISLEFDKNNPLYKPFSSNAYPIPHEQVLPWSPVTLGILEELIIQVQF
jgi:hypothetical protein